MTKQTVPITCSDGTPYVIESLWGLYETAKQDPILANIDILGEHINRAANQYLQTPDADYMAQLAQLWLYKTELQLTQTAYMYVSGLSIHKFICLLQHGNVVDRLLIDMNNLPCFSYALLSAARRLNTLHFETDINEVAHVVKKTLGKEVVEDAVSHLPTVTDLLYGVGTWAVYRPDVDDDGDLPLYLFYEKIPSLGILQAKGHAPSTIEAICPGDLA